MQVGVPDWHGSTGIRRARVGERFHVSVFRRRFGVRQRFLLVCLSKVLIVLVGLVPVILLSRSITSSRESD